MKLVIALFLGAAVIAHAQSGNSALKSQAKPKKAKKAKQPKLPSQDAIVEGCVTVYDIYSHGVGLWSGITDQGPGIEAKLRNVCSVSVDVFVSVGYFDSRGIQYGHGITSATVAGNSRYDMYNLASMGVGQGILKTAKIIDVKAYPN